MRQFNDDALERLGAATAHARRALPNNPFGGDTPNLVVLLRDARLRQQHEGRAVRPDTMLESALQRVGDPLDTTRDAIREFFHNRTMTAMKQPDEFDLSTMMDGGLPARGRARTKNAPAAGRHPARPARKRPKRDTITNESASDAKKERKTKQERDNIIGNPYRPSPDLDAAERTSSHA